MSLNTSDVFATPSGPVALDTKFIVDGSKDFGTYERLSRLPTSMMN